MHTRELWQMGDKYVPDFLGVFPLNKIPSSIRAPCNFIVNTHTHNLPGEHWIAVSYQRDGRVYAFDSFGLYYPLSLQNYLQRLRRSGSVYYNKQQFQELYERTCGHYCLHMMSIGDNV